MSRSPAEVIARAVHDNDAAYAPPYWDDCYDEMQRFYLEMGDKALAALADAGWSLFRPDECATVQWCADHQSRWGYNPNCGWSPTGKQCPKTTYRLVPVEGEN